MLAKRIIACLDCKDGVVIKGARFKEHEVVGDILELAEQYGAAGIDELVLYDITASSDLRSVSADWIKKISRSLRIPFTVAGGIDSVERAGDILHSGAEKISINSPAISNPGLINDLARHFGSQAVVVSIDTQKIDGIDTIYKFTGDIKKTERVSTPLFDWVKEAIDRGAGELVINSIQKDGVKEGYDIDVLKEIRSISSVPIIASGGAGAAEHFVEVFQKANVSGALAASVFHKKMIDPIYLKSILKRNNIHVRV